LKRVFLLTLSLSLLFLVLVPTQDLEEKVKEKDLLSENIDLNINTTSNTIRALRSKNKPELKENFKIEETEIISRVYTGIASWYGKKFHGRTTANGERFDKNQLTAAHRTLPFNTNVKVTYLENEKSVIVRINDRGPFIEGRIIDLSEAAASKIDMTSSGIGKVKIEILK